MTAVPGSLADLTPSWMTAALAARCPGAVVGKLAVGETEDGTNRRARVHLAYDEGDGPASVFVKIHGRAMHRWALVALGALATEARLAESGAAMPLERPVPYAAAIDRSRLRTIVVMDDITLVGGRPNAATAPLSVEEVRSGLAGLASLHAAYWDRPLPASLQFLRPWRLDRQWAPVSGANLWRGFRRLRQVGAGDALPVGLSVGGLERQFRRSATLASAAPRTVLHGDPHPGNTYVLPARCTGFYDWQLARIGHWSHDVGYFIVSSLDVEDRRAHDKELLTDYVEALRGNGVAGPAPEHAWERYRATPAFGLGTWMHTLSAGSFQPTDVCRATIRRFAAAYDDLETARSVVAD
jgi:Ser/Thr protein kinase RdoA (MazF antagonist)